MWIGVFITFIIGGFLFYALATAYKHIENIKNIVEIINDTNPSSVLEKKDAKLIKEENMNIKNVLNVLKILKNKINKLNISEQKLITNNTEEEKVTNKNIVGLYLFDNIGNSILYTYGMLVFVSLPKVPTGWAIRVLTGWWWIYCLLVVVAYKASMTAILANPDTR